jgi:hypothetical protein
MDESKSKFRTYLLSKLYWAWKHSKQVVMSLLLGLFLSLAVVTGDLYLNNKASYDEIGSRFAFLDSLLLEALGQFSFVLFLILSGIVFVIIKFNVVRVVIDEIKKIKFRRLFQSVIIATALNLLAAVFIALMPVKEESLRITEGEVYASKLTFLLKHISAEFNMVLFFVMCSGVYFIIGTRIFKDYFPFSVQLKESGIHAKLNYQIIADRMSRKLSILLGFIIVFSLVFIFTIFKFSSELDLIIHDEDIDAYETWIASIENHVGKGGVNGNEDSGKLYEFVETNTEMFWTVYFIRYITVRIFIAFLVGTIITFLIRLYLRTKSDRSQIIQKEEALSAIHYLARGEWRYQYDILGNLLFKCMDSDSRYKQIITESEYAVISDVDKTKYKPLVLDILKNDDDAAAHIDTKDLLEYIPIRELFSSTEYTSSRRRSNKHSLDDYSLNLDTIKKQLSEISNELKNYTIIVKKEKDSSTVD